MTPRYKDFSASKYISYDIETYDPNLLEFGPGVFRKDGYMLGFSLADESGFAEYYNVRHPGCTGYERDKNLAYLREVMALPQPKIGVKIMYDINWTEIGYGIPVAGTLVDICIAEALLDENLMHYDLDSMSHKYLGIGKQKGKPEKICEDNGWKGDFRKHLYKMSYEDVYAYGVGDATQPIRIFGIQQKLLAAQELMTVFDLENKITRILLILYRNGVRIDTVTRDRSIVEIKKVIAEKKKILYTHHGEFNYNSSKQIAALLDSLDVQYPINPETENPILDAHSLTKLSAEVPFVSEIILVKKLDKILGTFLEGSLTKALAPDGRIHPSFYNTKTESEGGLRGTRSGRFSCLAAGTLILTGRGQVPIEDIQAGDVVVTHRGNWAPVIALLDKGYQETVVLIDMQQHSIICTKDHLMLTQTGWSQAQYTEEIFYVAEQKTFGRQHIAEANFTRLYVYTSVTRTSGSLAHVYDIMLAHPDHSFIANGFAAHNCASPNLQQIPSYDKKERDAFKAWYTGLCRKLFIPEEGQIWGKTDYSQIEYRFMAHFACGPGSQEVRDQYNDDPHTDYHGMIEKLTGLPRKLAKNLNFGVGYGMGANHMAEFFGWDLDYCYEMLNTYHSKAPFIKATMKQVEIIAKSQLFIRTFLKRRSHLTDPKKAYTMFCRLCQGSAADLVKQAAVDIYDAGLLDVLTMALTVHDEYDTSIPPTAEGFEAFAEMNNRMENALTLKVPVIAEAEIGMNWAELKGFTPENWDAMLKDMRRK